MIKARGMRQGRPFVYIGLTHEMLSSLVEKPVVVDTALPMPHGLDLHSGFIIVIESGESDDAISEKLAARGFEIPGLGPDL